MMAFLKQQCDSLDSAVLLFNPWTAQCAFGEEFSPATLVKKSSLGRSTRLLTFALPESSQSLGLSTCACLLARGGSGEPVVRPYTPISTNALLGHFELLVKVLLKCAGIPPVSECMLGSFGLFVGITRLCYLLSSPRFTPMVSSAATSTVCPWAHRSTSSTSLSTVCCHEERRGVTRKGVRILQFVAQLSFFFLHRSENSVPFQG